MNDSELNIVVKARDQASTVIKNLQRQVEGSSRQMSSSLENVSAASSRINGALIGLGAAGAVAGAGLVAAFGASTIKSFMDSENAVTQLNAVLKSTNGVAGVTIEKATELATAFQKTTRYSDEAVMGAENMLLTFTNISKDVFPDTTEAVLDMATAMGSDLKSTAIQVGKALQDPIEGVTALQRVGVRLTEQQKKQVEAMVKAGDAAGAQRVILKELQTEFGGSAKAAGQTFAGKLDILRNSFDDVKESIGKVLVDGLSPLATKLSAFVQGDQFQTWVQQTSAWLQDNLPKAIDYVTTTVLPAFKKIFDDTWPTIKGLAQSAMDLFTWLSDHVGVVQGLVAAFVAWKAAMVLNDTFTALTTGLGLVKASATSLVNYVGGAEAALGWGLFAAAAIIAFQQIQQWIDTIAADMTALTMQSMTYADQLKKVNEDYKAGKITAEEYKKKVAELSAQMQAASGDANRLNSQLNNSTLGRALNFFANGGFAPSAALGKVLGEKASGKAVGGSVNAGTPYIVGETRPEVFIPNTQGRIVPNTEGVGGVVNNFTGTFNFNTAEAVDRFYERQDKLARLAQKGLPA